MLLFHFLYILPRVSFCLSLTYSLLSSSFLSLYLSIYLSPFLSFSSSLSLPFSSSLSLSLLLSLPFSLSLSLTLPFSLSLPLSLFTSFHRFEALPSMPVPTKHGCEAFLVSYEKGTLRDIPGLDEIRSFQSFRYVQESLHFFSLSFI